MGGLGLEDILKKNSRAEFCPPKISRTVNSIVCIVLYTNKKDRTVS